MKKQNHVSDSLRRCFGLRETVTLTVGTVIGVGLFTVGANAVGQMGPAVIWATLAALAASIYPSLLYAEMGAALPYAGGTYQYASIGLGRVFGMLSGWSFIISMVSVASGEAMAFSFYIRTLFEAIGISLPFSDTVIACGVLLLFLVLGLSGVEMTGRLQNGFLFFFWGIAIVWLLTMLPSLHFDYFAHPSPQGVSLPVFLSCTAMVWWCFAGFETCCAMGEEIKHPQINLPRALILAPFLVFAVNGLFQWVLACIVPPEALTMLAGSDAPYAEGMRLAGVAGLPLVLLCLGIAFGGDFSTLNASLTAPARYLYTMARDGALPRCFARLHPRYRTPYLSILVLGLLMLVLVATGSIFLVASLSLFATLLYYIIGIAAARRLRRKRPELARPYRAPLIAVGAPVSILIYAAMMTQLDRTALLAGILWCLLGLAVYFLYSRRHFSPDLSLPPLPAPPKKEERQKLDREYRRWRFVVFLAAGLVLLLYLLAYLLG